MIKTLLSAIPKEGSVVSYNSGFESRVLKELARDFPLYSSELLNIANRLVDPLPLIRSTVYDIKFLGSFSIKSVAPALLGESLSYEGMAVSSGTSAQTAFEELVSGQSSQERKREICDALRLYCKQDTLAILKLVEWLRANAAK